MGGNIIDTERVVIVGAGLAALYAALNLAPRPVVLISPESLGQGASSGWAQGGIAASLGDDDAPSQHAHDTEVAGAGTVDPIVAAFVTSAASEHVRHLTALGTPFDRDDGEYVLGLEAAHSHPRIAKVKGDQAGRAVMATLIEKVVQTPSIQVLTNTLASGLEVQEGRVTGVFIERASEPSTQPVLLRGAAHLLAGGGSAGLYAITTNPPRIRGHVIGMAARAGAVIGDPEFVQFHPTAIDAGIDPAPLATEALRGEGATLINKDGERFMEGVHPDMELAPRDIVARAIFSQSQQGMRPMLDTRDALGEKVLTQFPAVAEACREAGIDPVAEAIPVNAAAHYHMGGVAADVTGRTSLDGLWVAGEVASTGLHGANRLASNGLLEALVIASSAAEDMAKELGISGENIAEVSIDFEEGGALADQAAVAEIRQLMTDHVGVVRDAEGLKTALRKIDALERDTEPSDAFANMIATATLITAAALKREESRGGHYRSDFPAPDPQLAKRTKMTLDEALAIRRVAVEQPEPAQ
ncbi:L-aspartate oxidase [Notoacmeibacter sp. MSK16QG-6]|uniref:L-aspartate oxidase n=1 Tax=Notoacmeibacter sp. MSK16QG-6 TaxID=2957982 RepID=UPI0020A126C3|nr:L-aspartate oxidase [Notoacmeibacter sp. MSK16QG-6]MCP1200435.1 L-aspartate oxidase [Notoacmeibacter sp. MSK16QG-6]